ncbi:hypothetical protein GIX45_17775 [Erwinia sp. CPCC 100877]|nr:hypothetical protein [Erwinia sp. CPCC 100877]
MRIEQQSFVMNSLVCYPKKLKKSKWWKGFSVLEDSIFDDGIYPIGPMFFIAEENKKEAKYLDFCFYLPVNWDVEPSNKKKMSFVGDLSIKNALHFRQANDEDSFYPSLEKAREYAEKNNIVLEDRFICVYNNFYGESIFDIYLPLLKEAN